MINLIEVESIDFENDENWEEKLLAKIESYPRRHEAGFQAYLDEILEEDDVIEKYYLMVILDLILDGVMVANVDRLGQLSFTSGRAGQI